MDTSISFSKVVATPTLNSWSQVYNAGKLFAVLSLERTKDQNQVGLGQNQDIGSLNILGKSLLDTLEQEFFTTETKDLESIKKAILSTFEEITNTVIVSFVLGFFSKDILYLFILGKGDVFIKRAELGNILSSSDENLKNIVSSSGFVKDNDLIILETFAFSKAITADILSVSLETGVPTDATEFLAPKIHKTEDGRLAAIIIKYNKPQDAEEDIDTLDADKKIENETLSNNSGIKLHNIKEMAGRFLNRYLSLFKSKIRINSFRSNSRKKVFLIAAVAIAVILISNVFLTVKNQNNAKMQVLFSQIYPQAQKKYDEGQSLLDLNKNLARDSFLSAQKILSDNKSKFPPDSQEEKQISDLLKKINDALMLASAINKVEAKEVNFESNDLLSVEKDYTLVNFFTQDNNNVYFANETGITSVNKKAKKEKLIINNDSIWKNVGGIGAYLGNIYVLDPSAGSGQIFKFVLSEDGYAKANYFANDVSPDLSGAKALSIDGSIWILLADGNIEKFTRGKIESFIISGLDKPFSAPSRIFTNSDTSNLYVLDNGNSRIVVLSKEGAYKSQYQSGVLKDAKDFEVKETDKKIFILSGRKIWEIGLK